MPAQTIQGMTEDAAPLGSAVVETESESNQTRKVRLDTIRKHPLGEPVQMGEGADACMGVAALVAGTVTINTDKVTADSRIFLTAQEGGTLAGALRVSARVVGVSFTVLSTDLADTADVAWMIFEPI